MMNLAAFNLEMEKIAKGTRPARDFQPGDILLYTQEDPKRRSETAPDRKPLSPLRQRLAPIFDIANRRLQGPYTHAGIYAGEGQVIEALHDGVRKHSLAASLDGYKGLIVARVQGLTPDQRAAVVENAESYVGKPYSALKAIGTGINLVFDRNILGSRQDKNPRSFQCGSVVSSAYAAAGVPITHEGRRTIVQTMSPVTMLNAQGVKIVGKRKGLGDTPAPKGNNLAHAASRRAIAHRNIWSPKMEAKVKQAHLGALRDAGGAAVNIDMFNDEMRKIANTAPAAVAKTLLGVDGLTPTLVANLAALGGAIGGLRGLGIARAEGAQDRRLLDLGAMDPDVYRRRRRERAAGVALRAGAGAATGGVSALAYRKMVNALLDDVARPAFRDLSTAVREDVIRPGLNQANEVLKQRSDYIADRVARQVPRPGPTLVNLGLVDPPQAVLDIPADAARAVPANPESWIARVARAFGKRKTAARIDWQEPTNLDADDWRLIRSALIGLVAAGGVGGGLRYGLKAPLGLSASVGGSAGLGAGTMAHLIAGGFRGSETRRAGERASVAGSKPKNRRLQHGYDPDAVAVPTGSLLPAEARERGAAMAVQGRSERDTDNYFRGEGAEYRYGGKASGHHRFSRGGVLSGSDA